MAVGMQLTTVNSAVQSLDCFVTKVMQYRYQNKLSCLVQSISKLINITDLHHVGTSDCRP